MLGIGIITYERLGGCAAALACVQQYTTCPYRLVVADDGSTDGTRSYCLRQGVQVVGRSNRGVAHNYNRALWALRECDPIILLDSDIWPTEYEWQKRWIDAAAMWGHVNFCFDAVCGYGTAADPYLCEHFGCGCCATSAAAFRAVGYQDPRFYGIGFSIAHAEWTFRFEKHLGWKRATENSTPPCLRHGIRDVPLGTFRDEGEVEESIMVMKEIDSSEPVHRLPWRDQAEQDDFLSDLV